MSEQIPWNGILTVIGVGIGYSLSQLTDLVKNMRRKSSIKKALTNELFIIRKTLDDGRKMGNRISDERFPLIMETYDSVRIELASFLKPDSLAVVQKTYQEIRKINSVGGSDTGMARSLEKYRSPCAVYRFRQSDCIN
jgi:hypothetical protein